MARRVAPTLPDPAHNPTEVLVDRFSVHPETRSGDGFAYAASRRDAHEDVEAHYASLERLEAPHGCISGVVYIGEMAIGEDGEEVEVIHPMLCRRCHGETR